MSNESLAQRIRGGYSVPEDMQALYETNLPLIRKFIKPYASYEPMEDLLQEAYFGLWEAVQHYEISENVLFMTYARFWIVRSVQRYLERCGSTVRIPSHKRQKIARYKKTVQELEQELGRTPTDNEIADKMCISVGLLPELKMQMQEIVSLDTPLTDDNSLTLADTVQANYSLEDETIGKIYGEYSKSELWDIVECFISERESSIIKEIFLNNRTMAAVARQYGLTLNRISQIKETGLQKLRMGKAKRELLEKFDIADSALYRGGLNNYKKHSFNSVVEHTAVKRIEAEERYKQHLMEIEEMHRRRLIRKHELRKEKI